MNIMLVCSLVLAHHIPSIDNKKGRLVLMLSGVHSQSLITLGQSGLC